jgi:hypothetical protein
MNLNHRLSFLLSENLRPRFLWLSFRGAFTAFGVEFVFDLHHYRQIGHTPQWEVSIGPLLQAGPVLREFVPAGFSIAFNFKPLASPTYQPS